MTSTLPALLSSETAGVIAGNDLQFVSALKRKNAYAFEKFYDTYAAVFYGEIKRTLYTDEDSTATLVRAFEAIWNSIELYDETKEKLFLWALKIVKKEISTQKIDLLLRHVFSR